MSAPAVVPPVVERPVAPGTAPLPVITETPVPSAVAPPLPPAPPDAPPWSNEPLSVDVPDVPDTPPSPSFSVSPAHDLAAPCRVCATRPEPDDLFCAECGTPLAGDTRVIEPVPLPVPLPLPLADAQPAALAPAPAPAPAPATATAPAPAPATAPARDVESTRIVPKTTGGTRFVLQFSTGESYTVLGTGLAGRNPHPEPAEFVDHLVTIVDPGRSVSKTHFEFGQHEGVFWVSDRHSGNGSTIREPGLEPRSCEPGRRYPIVRGTRIDIGEQFVVIS